MPRAKLSPREQAFLAAYKKCLNASEAYRVAYKYKGNNENVLSSNLLASIGRKIDLAKITKDHVEATGASVLDVLLEFKRIGLSNVKDAVWQRGELDHQGFPTVPGSLKSILDMPLDFQRCISSIERDADGRLKLKLWDKVAILDKLARYHKLLTDKLEVTGKLSLEQLVSGANGKDQGAMTPEDL